MNGSDNFSRTIYRFRFVVGVDMAEVHEAMELAVLSVQSLRGEAEVRLDAMRSADDGLRSVAIDGTSGAGREVAKVFVAICQREFGPSGFRIDRVVTRDDIFACTPGSKA